MICHESFHRTFKHFCHLKTFHTRCLCQLTAITICHTADTAYGIAVMAIEGNVAPEEITEIVHHEQPYSLIVKMPVNIQRHACQKAVWQRLSVNSVYYIRKRKSRLAQIAVAHCIRDTALEHRIDKELAQHSPAAFIAKDIA